MARRCYRQTAGGTVQRQESPMLKCDERWHVDVTAKQRVELFSGKEAQCCQHCNPPMFQLDLAIKAYFAFGCTFCETYWVEETEWCTNACHFAHIELGFRRLCRHLLGFCHHCILLHRWCAFSKASDCWARCKSSGWIWC